MSRLWAMISCFALVSTGLTLPAQANPLPLEDPYRPDQWALYELNVEPVWSVTKGAGATIAVIDTGSAAHPEMVWTGGYDFVPAALSDDGDGWDADPTDPGPVGAPWPCRAWHGISSAALIGAQHNELGIRGVAPDATLVPVRALDDCGYGDVDTVATAIRWASGVQVPGAPANPNPARVIYLGTAEDWSTATSCPSNLRQALSDAQAQGSMVVAGSMGANKMILDCGVANLVAVSPYHPSYVTLDPDLFASLNAPGDLILTILPGTAEGYGYTSEASLAAAQVAGSAAFLIANEPALSLDVLLGKMVFSTDFTPSCMAHCAGMLHTYMALNYSGDPIEAAWAELGGASSYLGAPAGVLYPVPGGVAKDYQYGTITWSRATGPGTLFGGIKAAVYPAVPVGLPMGNEQPVPGGVVQHFGLGDVYWSPQTGAHYVSSGLIQRFYNEKGGPVSYLGFPVDNGWGKPRYGSDRELTMNQQQFEHGWVYYENRGQPHSVHGGVAAAYASQPGLGVPIGDETPIAGGVVQQFSNGRIYWSAATGGNTVRGGVWERYRDSGGPGGWLGLPTSGEIPTVGGVVQHFQHGEIYWKYPQGAFSVHGGVRARYALAGGPAGYLGFPTSSEEGPGQWVRQTFERGHIYWSWHTNAAYTVHGGVLTAYLGVGGIDSYLGLPTSSEIPTGGGVVQYFQRGWIGWTPAGSGVHVTG